MARGWLVSALFPKTGPIWYAGPDEGGTQRETGGGAGRDNGTPRRTRGAEM